MPLRSRRGAAGAAGGADPGHPCILGSAVAADGAGVAGCRCIDNRRMTRSPPRASPPSFCGDRLPCRARHVRDRRDDRDGARRRRRADRPHRQLVQLGVARAAARALEPVAAGRLDAGFERGSHYAINILAADQHALARALRQQGRRPLRRRRRFARARAACRSSTAPPPVFECFNRSRYEEGDHVIFVGEVERASAAPGAQPLIFHGGRYFTELPL